jgi:uncharacterized protein YfiM (DUF2279 family)
MPPPTALGRSSLALLALTITLGQADLRRADLLYAAEGDAWFGPDKALHFEAAGSLALVGYAGAAMITTSRPARAGAAGALAVGAGVAKELWDLDGHGDASWRDLTWDLVGATSGVLAAVAIDWAVHRIFGWPVARSER